MSDRPCNFCDFERLKREAKKKHRKVRAVPDAGWMRVQEAEIGTDNWTDRGISYLELPSKCKC